MQKEIEEYLQAKEDLAEVSKGGKYCYPSKTLDIDNKVIDYVLKKEVLIRAIGEKYLDEVLENYKKGEKLK